MRIAVFILSIIVLIGVGCKSDSPENSDVILELNEGLVESGKTIAHSTKSMYSEMDRILEMYGFDVKPFVEKSTNLKEATKNCLLVIDLIKHKLLEATGKKNVYIHSEDNSIDYKKLKDVNDKSYVKEVFIEMGEEKILYNELSNYYKHISSYIKEYYHYDTSRFLKEFEDLKSPNYNWSSYNLMEAFSILNKIESDVLIAENKLLNYHFCLICIADIPLSKVEVLIKNNIQEGYVGDSFETEIFLIAYDTTATPDIFIGDFNPKNYKLIGKEGTDWEKLESNGKGGANYTFKLSEKGIQSFKGYVKIMTPKGHKFFPFQHKITVLEKPE